MSVFIFRTRKSLLRFHAQAVASLLGIAGVLSTACDTFSAVPAYGPPGVSLTLTGSVLSAADSTTIPGIYLKALSPDSSISYFENFSVSDGSYYLYLETWDEVWPDTIRIVSQDVDGSENGSFLSADTLVFPPQVNEEAQIETDIFMEPEEE